MKLNKQTECRAHTTTMRDGFLFSFEWRLFTYFMRRSRANRRKCERALTENDDGRNEKTNSHHEFC